MKVHNPNNLPTAPIADLLPTQGDLKDLTDTNYKKLKNVIERRGFSYPVYVWEDSKGLLHLLDGHQRQRVLTTEGWNDPIPYLKVPAKDLQEAAARLLEITSQYATITQEGIDEFIATYDLNEAEVLEATAFDATRFQTEDEPDVEVEEDEAPEVSDEPPVSKLGEVYQLGRHKVMCGDSTDKANVELLMNGEKADMVFTDPPYGMLLDTDYSGMHKSSDFGKGGKTYNKVIGDNDDFVPELITSVFDNFGYCDEMFLWGADYYRDIIPMGGSWIVWDKRGGDTGMNLDKLLGSSFELCWSKQSHKRDIARILWSGHHGMQVDDTKSRVHPTQKPAALADWFFQRWAKGKKNIVDVYLGSGSTLIACEQTDRTCYGMELDPKYVDVIRKRYAKFTNDDELPENWEELTPKVEV